MREYVEVASQLYGDVLIVSEYESVPLDEKTTFDRLLRDASLVPRSLVRRLVDNGLRGIYVGRGAVADLGGLGYLRAAQPDGWSAGSTYADVPGAYLQMLKIVVVGTRGRPTPTSSLFLHELGHAVGHLPDLNDAPGLHVGHVRLADTGKLPRFALPAGHWLARRELFAELFALCILDRDTAVRRFDMELVEWFLEMLGEA